MTERQQKVIAVVKDKLKKYEWFQGVCLNDFPTDAEIDEDFEEAVERVIEETLYWDSPVSIFE